jgi:hypothetical protein
MTISVWSMNIKGLRSPSIGDQDRFCWPSMLGGRDSLSGGTSGHGLRLQRDRGNGKGERDGASDTAKTNRREQRRYDEYLYRLWHLAENAFAEMKRWHWIAMRYAKNAVSYLAAVHIRCIIMWARIY